MAAANREGMMVKLAMWFFAGPRNLSTAMMYAFAARRRFALSGMSRSTRPTLPRTGADHPMREAILAAGETDPARVAARLRGAGARRGGALVHEAHAASHGPTVSRWTGPRDA